MISPTECVVSRPTKSSSSNGPIGWLAPPFIAASICSIEPKPSSQARIASSRYGISSRLTMKPGLVLRVDDGLLQRLAPLEPGLERSRAGAAIDCTTSSSGITCTGLKKCRPRKRSGRLVTAAWWITGERGGVGGEQRLLLDDRVELAPHLELRVEVLGDRLDHQVAVGEVVVVEGRPGCGRAPRRRRTAPSGPSRPRGRAAS